MKKTLHTRIFFPVFLVFLIFPVFTWAAFTVTANEYFRKMAERNTNRMVQQMHQRISQAREDAAADGRRLAVRDILNHWNSQPDTWASEKSGKTSFLIISTDYGLVYPELASASEEIQLLYEACASRIREQSLPDKETLPLSLENRAYMIQLLEFPAERPVAVKYMVCYSSVPNTSSLLSSVWNLLILITVLCLALETGLIWFITRGLTRPLGVLCQKAWAIGRGDYTPISDDFQVRELETLKLSINQMAEDLKHSEESTVSFFQNASHDLKTPLASISGYAQGIQCGILDDPQKAAGIILNESLRMTRLVESILTISKLDNKTLKLQLIPIDLDEFLYEQLQTLRGGCMGKTLEAVEPLPSLRVLADGQLLIRIFQNLASNCLQYAESSVQVSLTAAGDDAEIAVCDDGPGIPPGELEQIFTRFYKGEGGGFGLGLSIARSGAEYMNGSVSAENRPAPEHGLIYRLRLPLYTEP